MKIYTRTGDRGETAVIGGRTQKDDSRVEAYGTIDELNSFLGQAVALLHPERDHDIRQSLLEIQHELFDCGTDLATLNETAFPYKVEATLIDKLEQWIDHYEKETAQIKRFILPGGSMGSALLHICRTICRRAERRVVTLALTASINGEILRYLNRLSDLLFTLARVVNVREGVQDVEYIRSRDVFT